MNKTYINSSNLIGLTVNSSPDEFFVDAVTSDYIFTCSESKEKNTIEHFINQNGDLTNGLWSQINFLNGKLITSLERSITDNSTEYKNFIIQNVNDFLDADKIYRFKNYSAFNFSEVAIEKFDSFRYEYLLKNDDSFITLKNRDYFSKYGNTTGKLFSKVLNFYFQLLDIYEDAITFKDNYKYTKFVSSNISDFLKREADFLESYMKI